ncbi:MAG: YihY/virulence factor BrkB family protein [Pseudolabrys sp.]|nr:YihY/virulence factor BrkB family protein [Pseudolabrys sp.]
MKRLRRLVRIVLDAFLAFLKDDGWGIASYIALSALMALFPFLIVVTALAGLFFGSKQLADEAAHLLLQTWPQQVAAPLSEDIEGVLGSLQGSALTFGAIFALYFASSGVESLRIGLNRAYSIVEHRSWWLLRIESIAYVIIGAVSMLAFSFLVVFAPLIWAKLTKYIPGLEPFGDLITLVRVTTAAFVIIVALVIVHLWLPGGRRSLSEVAPGILTTLVLWLVSGELFGRYLAEFAYGYVTMYAGLASAMIALIFLYICASIFLYGGELNAEIKLAREQRQQAETKRPSPRSRPRKSAARSPAR